MQGKLWTGLLLLLTAHAPAVEAAITATLEAQEAGTAAAEREGVFRLTVSGLAPEKAAILRSADSPIFQVVAFQPPPPVDEASAISYVPEGEMPAEPKQPADSPWIYVGRFSGATPQRFVLLASTELPPPDDLRELATLEPKRQPTIEGRPPLREDWLRARLEKIRNELLDYRDNVGFWRYQEAYLQHRLEGTEWVSTDLASWTPTRPSGFTGSVEMVTGLSAIEESLQLSVLRSVPGQESTPPKLEVPVTDLQGPTIKSHDFDELQKGLPPGPIPESARFAPEDSVYVGFAELPKVLELNDRIKEWHSAVSRLSDVLATDGDSESFVASLGLRLDPKMRPFYGLVIQSMALILDDPYLAEGADLALIFDASRGVKLFDLRIQQFDSEAKAAHPGLEIVEETLRDHTLRILRSPDGAIRSYRASVGNWRIFATSRGVLERVLNAWDAQIPNLATAKDFAYVRSVLPGGDGFAYFSDACVRRFVSPRFKIAELRRVRCQGNLRVLDYATDLSDMEKTPARSLGQLKSAGYLSQEPRCPHQGDYSYDAKASRFRCSIHGTSRNLALLSELPVELVTQEEAEGYKSFVENYNTYWPRFFDPIGIELYVAPKSLRFATCILPLIESSTYNQFKSWSGGKPRVLQWDARSLDQLGGIFSMKLTAFDGYKPDLSHIDSPEMKEAILSLRTWIENALPWGTDKDIFSWIGPESSLVILDSTADSLERLSDGVGAIRIAVIDVELANHLLLRLAKFAPYWMGKPQTDGLPPDVVLRLPGNAENNANLEILLTKTSMFVLWGRPEVRTDFSTKLLALKPIGDPPADSPAENAYLGVALGHLPQALKQTLQNAEQIHADNCLRNVAKLEDLHSFEAFAAETPEEILRRTRSVARLDCPDGGVYRKSGNEAACSIHGNRKSPKSPELPPQTADLRRLLEAVDRMEATLQFTPEGIRTSLTLLMATPK